MPLIYGDRRISETLRAEKGLGTLHFSASLAANLEKIVDSYQLFMRCS